MNRWSRGGPAEDRKVQERYIVDDVALVTGLASSLVEEGRLRGSILLHRRIVKSLGERFRSGDEGAIDSLRALREVCERRGVSIELIGSEDAPGEVRDVIREEATKNGAVVVTADPLTYRLCEALGVRTVRVDVRSDWSLEEVFRGNVMSLHLKEGVPPRVKAGTPGKWRFVELSPEPVTRKRLELFVLHLLQRVHEDESRTSFIEVDGRNVAILQYGEYRIVITRPPLSDGLEVTVVRPVVRKSIHDYSLPPVLMERLTTRAEGILIAGAPGMGKSTFAQAIAEYYRSLGKVVKTVESPRDLVLPADVTQYSKSSSTGSELHDVLLLSRPDYTVFDEMRNEEDFQLFVDLRLAGIGMVGVVHATSPIDAIQRVANRVDIGVVPSIIDTVIFMHSGEVSKVHVLEVSVKVPRGMKRADLARPTIEVKDLLTGEVEYEMYVFGERTFIVPVGKSQASSYEEGRVQTVLNKLIGKHIDGYELRVAEGVVRLEVPPEYMRVYVRKLQRRLHRICQQLGLDLEVVPRK